jgi:hypothetical protein
MKENFSASDDILRHYVVVMMMMMMTVVHGTWRRCKALSLASFHKSGNFCGIVTWWSLLHPNGSDVLRAATCAGLLCTVANDRLSRTMAPANLLSLVFLRLCGCCNKGKTMNSLPAFLSEGGALE